MPTYRPHETRLDKRDDGALIYRAAYDLDHVAERTGDWLHHWAEAAPDRTFLAERYGAGWREVTYAEALEQVRAIAGGLLARGFDTSTPVLVMSGNCVDHGLLALAGQYVGVPVVPVAEQYALIHGAHGRLRHAVEMTKPRMAYAVDAGQYAEAIALNIFDDIEVVASNPAGNAKVTPFADLLAADTSGVDAAFAATGPDTVGKILLTSGSTSAPKGVPTTNRMMCTNQAQLGAALPFLKERPPVLVDWLPWNHVFGGSHNFNMVLANGGTLYVDDGKPTPALISRTVENLTMVSPTISFNVPVGFAGLVKAMETDDALRKSYFADLDMIFYAGASLPQDVWEGIERAARKEGGEPPLMNSSWGLTETAPAALLQHELTDRSGIVGVPLAGVEVKLLPDEDMRCEVRVKGPSIFAGYLDNPEKTAEAFDDEGFFLTGDAMKFVDDDNPDMGLKFDGRISEDFKLLTGTWVRAAQLRLDMLAHLGPLVSDLVVTGADRNEIGVMIFPNVAELEKEGYATDSERGALTDKALKFDIARRLATRLAEVSGSSSRVTRALILAEPPSMGDGEMTAKGNLNYRKILDRRKTLLERLYDDADPATIKAS
ncbi:feruloyl-CoA synthase [Maritimibacter dapengensis]|uniref:Feruloyl-CoA synthase n=1 Tax=Maritimibacter dapengensis TaxID=2836868 RepID=A0ABS6SXE3_9RHOB|nr:feruloyl-CoA synthase [Maritimibacter dapengensis]MBV7377634.1 feruloyl-CoA synthase [Maritimibacter dapengensis]